MKNIHPILNFRLIQKNIELVNPYCLYSIKTGIHTIAKGAKQADKLRLAQTTMLTETREATDSSENA